MKILTALFGGVLLSMSAFIAQAGPAPQFSVQLWSVKDAVEKDFKGTLKSLADMGFDGVEFAGNYGGMENDPAALKAFMEKVGLKSAGAHVHFPAFEDDQIDATLTLHKTLGTPFLIIPMDGRAWDPEGVKALVADLNRVSALLAPHGIKVGYHNHHQEFAAYGEATYWDYIAQNTGPDVVMQLDVGWVTVAGFSPAEYVKRYPGRTMSTHYKSKLPEDAPEGALPLIGEGVIDWKKLYKANRKYGGTLWYTVEQEDYPNGMSSMDAVKTSFTNLKTILKL